MIACTSEDRAGGSGVYEKFRRRGVMREIVLEEMYSQRDEQE